ncbi:AAC family N-acetyltransferase [Xenorhabdus eapokensis]|uniref:AAC family N-acetyltransferase n=1 Tax=Xenorhabdus eapokensis TaxID=1873482 RepID=A0A1Q5TZE5_9GAMM|nr:AAC family N-acetyltransferase [Xenorhabdus eapokensis]
MIQVGEDKYWIKSILVQQLQKIGIKKVILLWLMLLCDLLGHVFNPLICFKDSILFQ